MRYPKLMTSKSVLLLVGLIGFVFPLFAQTSPATSTATPSTPPSILLLDGTALKGKAAGHDESQLYVSSDSGFAKYPLIEIQSESLAKLGVLSKTDTDALWARIQQLEAALVAARKQTSVQVIGQVLDSSPQIVPDPTPPPSAVAPAPSVAASTTTPVTSGGGTVTPYVPSSGTVYVNGYYRKDGTYVNGYYRRK